MLLRNLDAEEGLCNGVRAIMMRVQPQVLDVVLLSGSKAGSRVYLPRMVLAPKNPDLPFVLRRRQFPVKLAWCMTFNKAQGQTLKLAGLFLSTPVFSHGQLYVGLSRAGSSKSVKVLVEEHESRGYYEGQADVPDGVYTDNVVWKEALLHDSGVIARETLPPKDVPLGDSGQKRVETFLPETPVTEECFDVLSGAPQTQRTDDQAPRLDWHGATDLAELGSAPGMCVAAEPKEETLFPDLEMDEEWFDALSGAPPTPITGEPEQRLDRHGATDLDEFGSAPGNSAETDVHILAALIQNDSFIDLTTSEDLPLDSVNDEAAAGADELPDVMEYLRERAQFYGVGPSEWYKVFRRSLPEIIAYIETFQLVSSRGASSSA